MELSELLRTLVLTSLEIQKFYGLNFTMILLDLNVELKYRSLFPLRTGQGWTPIKREKRKLDLRNARDGASVYIVRSQFPVCLAAAVSIHKTQGKSLDYLEIDLESRQSVPGLHYVALSRCRSEEGIQ